MPEATPAPRAAASRLRIAVLGYVVRGPLGGMVWSNLQYLRGLARLGHDVFFVEDSDDHPSCYDPERGGTDVDPGYGLRFAERVFRRIGFAGRWAYHDAHAGRWYGPDATGVVARCAEADLLLDLCGVNPLRGWTERIPVRVLVDQDPAFTQIRHLTQAHARARALAHDAYFSFGANLGRPGCSVPDDGLSWRATRQPVVLDEWSAPSATPRGFFTTVMQWESYAPAEYGGRRFEMKSASFLPYLDLPAAAGPVFELALGGARAPRDLLRARGWRLLDPVPLTRDPWTYERYLRASRAEFSVAKHGYVTTRSGWFSERSVAYLALGRPALVQDTGFTDWLPSGKGLLAFRTPDEAAAGVEEILRDTPSHARAARELAQAHFASGPVLSELLEAAFAERS